MEGTPPTDPTAPTRRSGSRVGRAAVGVAVLGMVAMWGYVLYLAFGPGRAAPPDQLADPAFAEAAEERCIDALALVAQLQPAPEATSALERAEVLEEANGYFADMLDDLEASVDLAQEGEDRAIVRAWLTDWRTYLGDRQDYVAALRTDPTARLLVTPKDGQQITDYLDAFAKDNHMPACSTPLDAA